jgi:hypothetical protein
MGLFLRLTVLVGLALIVLVILSFVLKILLVAAIVAAVAVAVLALANRFRRRGAVPMTLQRRR